MMKTFRTALAVLLSAGVFCVAQHEDAPVPAGLPLPVKPSPPRQPAKGPGGAEYPHRGVKETEYGEGGKQYWIMEPAQPSPKTAPLVIFLHGWTAFTPDMYRGWINHIVRRGNVVIYPRYQAGVFTPPTEFFPNSATAIREALGVLAQPGHVKLDLDRVAVVGHSAGGVQTANYAVQFAAEKLPAPKAAMIVEPGQGKNGGMKIIPMEECAKFPATLKLIVMVGEADGMVGEGSARAIWRETKHVRERAFVTLRSDAHGMPPLNANHLAPLSWSRFMTDALDWLGLWRTFDVLMDEGFSSKPLTVDASMGAWSDGIPVTPMKVER